MFPWDQATNPYRQQPKPRTAILKDVPPKKTMENKSDIYGQPSQKTDIQNNSLVLPSMQKNRDSSLEKASYADELNKLITQYEQNKKTAKDKQREEELKLQEEYNRYQPYGQDRLKLLQRVTQQLTKQPIQSQNNSITELPLQEQRQRPIENRPSLAQTLPVRGISQQQHQQYQQQQLPSTQQTIRIPHQQQALLQGNPLLISNMSIPNDLNTQQNSYQQYNSQPNPVQQNQNSLNQRSLNQAFTNIPNQQLPQQYIQPQHHQPVQYHKPSIQKVEPSQSPDPFHVRRTEKTNLVRQLNQINENYMKQMMENMEREKEKERERLLLEQKAQAQEQQIFQEQQKQYEQQTNYNEFSQPRPATIYRQPSPYRDPESERRNREREEALQRQIAEQQEIINKQMEQIENYRRPTQTMEVQTNQSDTFYTDKMNEYIGSLKHLSNDVITIKNQYTGEQQKLNHQLLKLREQAQRDYEEKLRLQQQLADIEAKKEADRKWEAMNQERLLQALNKNQPIQQYQPVVVDYRQLNPRVTRMDGTRGYEYDEPSQVTFKTSHLPIDQSRPAQLTESYLQGQRFNHRENDHLKQINTGELNYTSGHTRANKVNEIGQPYYKDYLLENDRRLYELDKLMPNDDREAVATLYKDKLI